MHSTGLRGWWASSVVDKIISQLALAIDRDRAIMKRASIVNRAEPDASAFRLISRRALAHGFLPM
jgi:hypothetical protein